MINNKNICIFLILFILVTILSLFYFHKNRNIDFELVSKMNVQASKVATPIGFEVYYNKKELETAYALRDIPGLSSKLKTLKIDFDNFNCLVVFGSEISKINYSWRFVYFDDTCARQFIKSSIPVRVIYENASQDENFICFYQVPKNPKIRNLCG